MVQTYMVSTGQVKGNKVVQSSETIQSMHLLGANDSNLGCYDAELTDKQATRLRQEPWAVDVEQQVRVRTSTQAKPVRVALRYVPFPAQVRLLYVLGFDLPKSELTAVSDLTPAQAERLAYEAWVSAVTPA